MEELFIPFHFKIEKIIFVGELSIFILINYIILPFCDFVEKDYLRVSL